MDGYTTRDEMNDTLELNALLNKMVKPLLDESVGRVMTVRRVDEISRQIKNLAWNYSESRCSRVRSKQRSEMFETMNESFKDEIVADIINICEVIGMDPELVMQKTKGKADAVAARHLCVYLIVNKNGYDSRMMARIGKVLSGRDRATIYHSYKTAVALLHVKDPYFTTIHKEANGVI